MTLGENIRRHREDLGLTQEQVAEGIGVSFQAVSSWERGKYMPDTDKLIRLAALFDVSVSALVEEKTGEFMKRDSLYNWEHMKTFVKATAKALRLDNTLKAVDFAVRVHSGQKRKKSEVPYIYHPLNMACHALSMGITDDEIIASCLLHDVIEDCGKTAEELPVSNEIRNIVVLLTHEKTSDEDRECIMDAYYKGILTNPKAALVKYIDRCNNITSMAWGLSRERTIRMIRETEKYYPALMELIRSVPEYNNAAWLLGYQTGSMLEIYKRLL
ncbi:MAG: helix-turn-helix domain-containing protein [Clostridiales bacterium]|nr:helix-turn-helix domain-containing protein [Clostridiales bacterium]